MELSTQKDNFHKNIFPLQKNIVTLPRISESNAGFPRNTFECRP